MHVYRWSGSQLLGYYDESKSSDVVINGAFKSESTRLAIQFRSKEVQCNIIVVTVMFMCDADALVSPPANAVTF
jgi:hypothetical protein